jgi:hypothetical protein
MRRRRTVSNKSKHFLRNRPKSVDQLPLKSRAFPPRWTLSGDLVVEVQPLRNDWQVTFRNENVLISFDDGVVDEGPFVLLFLDFIVEKRQGIGLP